MILYLPENLDIKDLLLKRPFEFVENRKYDEDVFRYIINLLYTIPATNKQVLTEEDFVPINSSQLNDHFFGYRRYLEYLLEMDVIETDNHYITQEDATNSRPAKFKGYRFKPEYLTRPKAVEIENKVLDKISVRRNKISRRKRRLYNHLIKWFNPALKIDDESAAAYINNWYDQVKDDRGLWGVTKKGDIKDPKNTLFASIVGIDLLKNLDFRYTVDKTARRFHSNLTNLKKELRNFINYDGQELVGLDLRNSQPYLSLILFNKAFWTNEDESLNIKDVGQEWLVGVVSKIKAPGSKSSSYHMLDKLSEIKASTEFQAYQSLAASGRLYVHLFEQIQDEFELFYGVGIHNFKLEFIKSLYADNQYTSIVKRQFKNLFPEIHAWFTAIRTDGNEKLPILLQSIESNLFLLRIAKRISIEMPWLPLFTIHDNIVTTKGYEDHVLRIAQEELTQCIGVRPEFGKEVWNPQNLSNPGV